tara:strand:+ start:251 stop:478 length:228 start_codon:yes stop_codon:yes gene_type:complete
MTEDVNRSQLSVKLKVLLVVLLAAVYMTKDIVFHEYRYWKCLQTQKLIVPERYERDGLYEYEQERDIGECLRLIN